MADAWKVRGAERQEFIDAIKHQISEEENDSDRWISVQLPLCIALSRYLAKKEEIAFEETTVDRWYRYVEMKILPKVTEFARTPEEALSLVAEIFKWEAESIVHHFQSLLQTQEINEPEKVFNGHKAMDNVPYP